MGTIMYWCVRVVTLLYVSIRYEAINKMKDFLGHPINVGDVVVAAVTHGRNSGARYAKDTLQYPADSLDGTASFIVK